MADYATLADTKQALGVGDTTDDARIAQVITAASRMVDAWCKRPDNAFVGQSQARVYDVPRNLVTTTPYTRDATLQQNVASGYWSASTVIRLPLDLGLLAPTLVQTDANYDGVYETTWVQNTDYDLLPINAALDNRAYREFRVLPTGSQQLPVGVRTLKIAGTWGEYQAVPDPIREATIATAVMAIKAAVDAPFGVIGNPEFGTQKVPPVPPVVLGILCEGGFVDSFRFA